MAADTTNDRLPVAETGHFQAGWDWKSNYVSSLAEDGLERFSQFSATPDTTVLYAGPARFTGLSDDASGLIPIGLTDQIAYTTNPSLARLFEVGSNRSFFTRGKTANGLTLGKMLADQKNILAALTQQAYHPVFAPSSQPANETQTEVMMNLDSEYFAVPFGLMLLFKTRGGSGGQGKPLTALYLEYCMFSNYQFQIGSSSPVIVESIAVEFDRCLPVSLN